MVITQDATISIKDTNTFAHTMLLSHPTFAN